MQENFIKSFEIADGDGFGDIVSKTRKNSRGKLKVGLLPLAWFEWWPMFPESGMRENILSDCDRFVEIMKEKFGDKYDLVYPDYHVDTLDKAFDVGELFKKEGVDMVIVDEATYVTDYFPIQVIDALPNNVPLVLFVTQATDNLWDNMKNTDVIRYEGLVSIIQLAGAFSKMGRAYKAVVGSLEDEGAFKELGDHMQCISLIHDLKYMDIGIVGHTFRGMYDIEVDKTKIKGVFGPNVLYLDVTHLLDIWNALTDKEIDEFVVEVKKELPYQICIDEQDLRKSASVGLAVKKMIKRFGIDGLTLLGQHHVEVATKASADLSFFCAENDGCMTTHEGDFANLVMKYILYKLTGQVPVFLEWSAYDIKSDTMLLTHHGVIDPKVYAAKQDACRITPSPEKWDFTGKGCSVEFCSKAGKVTLACLIDTKVGWKLLLSGGECLEMPQAPSFAPQFHFKHESLTIKDYIKKIVEEGVAHHVCLVYGDCRETLKLYAEYSNIEIVEI